MPKKATTKLVIYETKEVLNIVLCGIQTADSGIS